MRRPDANGAVPAAGAEAVFGDEVPIYAEDFAVVLAPVLDWEVVEGAVEELDAAVARGCEDLVFVDFGPGQVVEGILRGVPGLGSAWYRRVQRGIQTDHFKGTIPLGVSSNMNSRPLPTSPKLDEAATARRLSKNGEYFTPQPLKPFVRNCSIVEDERERGRATGSRV